MSASFTEVYGRVILGVFVVAVLLAIARAAFAVPVMTTPAQAIERAVTQRVGGVGRVHAASIDTKVSPEPGLQALPEPGGRTGQPVRFVLTVGKARRGSAVATVTIDGIYARALRAIARDRAIADADVELVEGEWPSVAFARLPAPEDVVGLQARRNIAPGEVLTNAVLDVPPLVRAGETVTVTARVGVVEVTGEATASSSGHRGEIIRVTPKPGARALKARIIAPGSVEVVQ